MPNIVRHTEFKKVVDALWSKIKTNFITDITYNPVDRTLNKTKNNLNEEITKVVTEWKDLEYTTQSSLKNVFDKNTQVTEDRHYFVNIGFVNDQSWRIATIPCSGEKQFTIVKMSKHDSGHIAFLDERNRILGDVNASSYTTVGGKTVYRITIPSNLTDVAYFTVNIHKQTLTPDQLMVFSGHIDDSDIPTKYVPFSDGATVLIDSNEVALSFDGTGTDLSSATIHSVIKELNGKIANAGGGTVTSVNGVQPVGGNVSVGINNIPQLQDSLDNKVDTSLVGNNANKIPVLDRNGKLENSTIPNLAITDVFVVADENAMMQQTVEKGDVVVVENEGNKTYMCKDALQPNKLDRFIEINMGIPMVMKVNNISPSATGELDIKGNQIPVSNTIATSISDELDKCVRTVNGQQPLLQGDVTINAGQILAVVGNQAPNNVQVHLNNLHTNIGNNTTRIANLERKRPTLHIGEIITTFEDKGNSYQLNGVEYIYLGRQNNTITSANYRDLTTAFGLPTTTRAFDLPYIPDVATNFDFGKNRNRKTYIVARYI